jgi:hypothetical protein
MYNYFAQKSIAGARIFLWGGIECSKNKKGLKLVQTFSLV